MIEDYFGRLPSVGNLVLYVVRYGSSMEAKVARVIEVREDCLVVEAVEKRFYYKTREVFWKKHDRRVFLTSPLCIVLEGEAVLLAAEALRQGELLPPWKRE